MKLAPLRTLSTLSTLRALSALRPRSLRWLALAFMLLPRPEAMAENGANRADAAAETVEWRHYAADQASSKYSPATQIDAGNVDQLEIAWRWTTPDGSVDTKAPAGVLKGTPLMVDGVLYAVSSLNLVSAIDPTVVKIAPPRNARL